MNKLSILSVLTAVAALGLTGCKDDTQPRLQDPTPGTFKVFEPALNNYTYYLAPDATIELVTSQPDYGLGTVTQYELQACLSEDFKEATVDPATGEVANEANYQILTTVNTQARIQMSCQELAVAMCALYGITTDEDVDKWDVTAANGLKPSDVQPVYIRVAAYVADPKTPTGYATGSYITSNVVKLNSVKPFFAVRVPAEIYLIGKPQGWNIESGEMALTEAENGIGSDIYTGVFEFDSEILASGGGGFRFYKELDNWGDNGAYPSIGANANDGDNTKVTLDEESLSADVDVVAGKGNFQIENWPGGWMKMTVNLVDMNANFKPGDAPTE
ncbi:MAG: SusE domain-containing protein [Muribaculaceae bacterium]|nr:SusE domain-containing protein [Muribaculaceae bacterium]